MDRWGLTDDGRPVEGRPSWVSIHRASRGTRPAGVVAASRGTRAAGGRAAAPHGRRIGAA
ncbi:hypothetical protein D7I47_06605 [Protaetiibacter intestinalis]|uniref:Uncharacterized protein n=1 Tax=Protaetiibacter intestinalis TaxID=2419774 RepID=A0A387BAK1_9MICO|nr:hypothetical protein D7I47_06605 [Protaetiibacter intestinalis]